LNIANKCPNIYLIIICRCNIRPKHLCVWC